MTQDKDEVFALTDGERNSSLWRKLVKHYGERLDAARVENDREYDVEKTATLRGRIKECKYFISLDQKQT